MNKSAQQEKFSLKQAGEAFWTKESMLADVFESIQDGISILDSNLTIRRTNEVIKKWYPENLPLEGKKCHKCYQNRDEPCNPCPTIRCFDSGETEREIVPGLPGSSVEWLELFSFPIKDQNSGLVMGVVEFVRDITQRKRAEKELRESEEKYRLLVENSNDAIFIAQDEVLKFCNSQTEQMIGYTMEELSEIPFINLIHPDYREMVLERHKKRLCGENPPSTYSFRIINRADNERWVQLSTVRITWKGQPATLNFLMDTTEQKKLEDQLQQAQKMEAIGTLAGGIAHDFNNLMMGILGNTSLARLDIDPTHPNYEKLTNIEVYVKSATELTKQLLGFARAGKYEVRPTNLNHLVDRSGQMFGRTKKEIKIHKKYYEKLWPVEVDQGQIDQVLLNIYVNAWQAMPEGGNLYIQTENVVLDENYTKPFSVKKGKYAKISITDTGGGMDEKTLKRIFDPFFTTKEKGRGTGLGLASAYGIIKNHGGIINAYSETGCGATFSIYLPAYEGAVFEKKELPDNIYKSTGTILLVDDEEMIVDVGRKILEKMGYTVLTAINGEEALNHYRNNQEKIDIVILDMVMPEMNGGDTYDRLKEMDPDVKVLLSSGYSLNGQAKKILDRGCNGFIQKPFSMNGLSKKLSEILAKS
ncbi:MAG: PAS domain S-box protein [Desulfobacterales bacterium]|nr:MAG: PAS domain S-box protein [Desulfobacterales bacterium]